MLTLPVVQDPALVARIARRIPLTYRDGPDPATDRPAHVRAASAIAWIGHRLVIVQDDASFLAIADPPRGRADAVPLPPAPDGRRQFDDTRGNKAQKFDLESCITLPRGDDTTLIAFGSGSTPARERIVVADDWGRGAPRIEVVPAPELYDALRSASDFAGSELNIEGAVLIAERELRLFGRGNGAASDGRCPVNATCALDWPAFAAYLHDRTSPPPRPHSVRRYDLGTIGDTPLGFTDAIVWPGGVLYAAAAEASPDAVRDGPVAGSALGLIPDSGGPPRSTRLLDEHGTPFIGKLEGIAPGGEPRTLYGVVDDDDPARPSELCVIRLEGW